MEIKHTIHSFKLTSNKNILSKFKYYKYTSSTWKVILICDVETPEKYRQHGYAYTLLHAGIEKIKAKYPEYMIYLAVTTDNTSAINLYKKLGFNIYGTLKQENGLNYIMAISDKYLSALADSWGNLFKDIKEK